MQITIKIKGSKDKGVRSLKLTNSINEELNVEIKDLTPLFSLCEPPRKNEGAGTSFSDPVSSIRLVLELEKRNDFFETGACSRCHS